jgi:hypothetical protein
MRKIESLKRSVRESAEWRGHTLGRWKHFRSDAASNECVCGAYVHVDCRPPANGIDIGGDAVALNHPIKREG